MVEGAWSLAARCKLPSGLGRACYREQPSSALGPRLGSRPLQPRSGCASSGDVAPDRECRYLARRHVNRLGGTARRCDRVLPRLQRHRESTVGTGRSSHSRRAAARDRNRHAGPGHIARTHLSCRRIQRAAVHADSSRQRPGRRRRCPSGRSLACRRAARHTHARHNQANDYCSHNVNTVLCALMLSTPGAETQDIRSCRVAASSARAADSASDATGTADVTVLVALRPGHVSLACVRPLCQCGCTARVSKEAGHGGFGAENGSDLCADLAR